MHYITFFNRVIIFLPGRAVLVFSVLPLTFLNRVSIFLAARTVLVFFSLYSIHTLVVVCNTLVACYLELRFNVEDFFIFSLDFCFLS